MTMRMPETDAGLHLVQHDQHVDQCICPDINEAPPPYAEACVAKRTDMIVHALAIEAEARGAEPTARPPWAPFWGRVRDAGGGEVAVVVDRDTAEYPEVGDRVGFRVISGEKGNRPPPPPPPDRG